jgi:solute carrier family 25 protein 38
LRDAPYAGLFLVFYEAIKHEAAYVLPLSSPPVYASLHGGSAAVAGTIATLATHPFDVIKVPSALSIFSRGNGHLHHSVDKDASSQ